ncbi:MAG TPA: 1-phosphofructokinase family hexose kinase [Galbitalea sp.]
MARIVVLTPNPAIDVTYVVSEFKEHETNRVGSVARRAGGKGVNVSRVLAQLGFDSTNVLPLGGSAGEWMAAMLARDGLAFSSVPISVETRTTVTIVDGDTHPTLFAEPGPQLDTNELELLSEAVRAECAGADLLVISGSLPPGMPPAIIEDWVADARAVGVPTILDTGGQGLLAGARAGADILKPNEDELREATGSESVHAGTRVLRGLGARLVVVSRGSRGMVAARGDDRFEVDAVPGISGNPTGAGDAATAGLASAFVEHLAIDEMLHRARALGAAAVLTPLAGDIDLEAYRRFLASSAPPSNAIGEPA